MNNTQSAQTLRRRIALFLLVSTINFIASPFFAGSSTRVKAAPLKPFDGPTDFIRRIPLVTNDLVYSSTTGKIYASFPSSVGSNGNSIAAIDPMTGVVSNTTFIGSEPTKLALSDDGHSLYAWLDGSFMFRRFDVLTNTPGIQFSMGQEPTSGRYVFRDFAVAPSNPSMLAVARGIFNVGSPQGVAIFDDGVRRPNIGPTGSGAADSIAFSASASKLYGTGPSSGLQTMTIDGSGVSVSSTSSLGQGTRIKFSNGLIYTSSGQVINPDTSTLLGTFAVGFSSHAFTIDTSVSRAYYLIDDFGTFTLKAFDLNTFALVGSLTISGVSFFPGATPLLRWGANGLALRTDKELILIQTSLIPSAEPIPTPTPTPTSSPTPSPSPSPGVPAFVRQIPLATNDLVFSQATQKFYASVPSAGGSTGNSIAEIDPISATVTNQTFVGSEPTVLGQSDDGATLYVGLDGAASIRSYNILNHTAGAQFIVGRDTTDGPYGFSDIAVAPGNPSAVAVARQKRNILPGVAGVAIFDNGVQRPNTGPGVFSGGSNSIAFASASVLYGDNLTQGLSTLAVDNSGVSLTNTNYFVPGNKIILANGLIYGSRGQVINPTTGELVGVFSQPFGSDVVHAVDVANGRAFFMGSTSSGLQLRAYDLNTFLMIGFASISSTGFPRNLVRWGTNGLAFFTDSQRVVLVETSLVSGSGAVPSPTPTPSPTPSPSPAYIPTFITRVNLPANNLVISEATHALYASVPSVAGANGNSITKIIPETAQVGPSVFMGSEPNRMAISNDGQTLWAYLNGANAVRRFDILTETAGLQFTPIPAQQPTDMEVVPGSPGSVALANGQSANPVAIYDNGVKRPNTGNAFPSVDPIEFGANSSVLYGYNSFHDNAELVKYLVDSSGLTTSDVTLHLFPRSGSPLKFVDGLLYTGSGRVVDPEAKTWLGKFNVGGFQVMCVDAANHRVYYATTTGSAGTLIRAFDSNTFLPLGSINVPGVTNIPVNLVRWGVNGLAFNTVAPFGFQEPSRVYLIQSELVSDAGTIPVGLELERNQISAAELSSPLLVKVMRTGDDSTSVSVDYATSDGTATAGSDYTATSGTLTFASGELTKFISIPISDDNVFENGNETFNLTLSNPTNAAVFSGPATATVSIFDNENKPFLFLGSDIGFFVPEGDSGTSTINFRLTLINPTVQTVTVDYATVNGTATAGSDYTAASGTITIPAGASFATGSISINGDTTVEPNETFTVLFSNITNTSSGGNFGQLAIILNDDASVQLSSNALSVNEGAGFVDVNVTRTGDTSRAATVLYSTTDTAGLQNCTIANSKASERCDYGTAVGRIQFAIGETTKTFTIPIVNDALIEGDETFTVNLTSPTGATLGTNTAVMTIVDNDTSPATQNPIDGVTPFITQQYIDFLGRLPDPIGLANWTDTLGNCPDGGFGEFANPTCDRVHVSAGFFLSEEFRGRGYFAYKFYEVGFDRRPAYAEFVPDMAQVGGPQSPASEVISKAAYTDAFVQRQEFKNRYDALSNSAYVDALETNAEVTLANKAALVAALDGNQKTRAQVLREIVELQSATDKFFIRAFVAMQYFGYLRRDPDTIGYNNWVNTLTADPSNFRHMIFGFIFSDEYRGRFGP